MRRLLRTLMGTAAACLVVAAPAVAVPPPERGERPNLQAALDRIVASGAVGAWAEVRDGRGTWRAASGVAKLGTSRPVPDAGRFRVGSLTKTFLATVVLQLVDEGVVRLDDPVDRWLPGLVSGGDDITIRHLLNHTSGVFDYLWTLPLPPSQEFVDNRWRTWTAEELLGRALVHPPTFEPPGSAFGYSNTGYVLLGEVVREATGRSYAGEIERRIIDPLRLGRTSAPGTSTHLPGPGPRGYVPVEDDEGVRLVDFTRMNPSVMGAGGEMISSTGDLNRFLSALLTGELLPARLLTEMRTAGTPSRDYGLGLAWRDMSCGVRVYGNDGDSMAYLTHSWATGNASRQVTLAVTPDFSGDPDPAIDAFLDEVICR